MTTPPNHLGQIVREALAGANISENRAALLSGMSRETLRRRLAGSAFDVDELAAIASILDTTASELMARAERAA